MQIETSLVDGLAKIGLTQYQARAYIASVVLGEASAYLIAQESDVPRSKVYSALDDLVEMGFISKIPSDKGTLYKALSTTETFPNELKKITSTLSQVEEEMDRLEKIEKERSVDPPIIIFNNITSLLEMLIDSEFYEAWMDNTLENANEIRKVLDKKKCDIHFISSTVPLAFIMGPEDSFFIRGANGSQVMIKFSNKIIQQILGMIDQTKLEYREEMTRESGVRILRETAIMDVEDKIKLVIPGFNLKQEKILFWGIVDNCSGTFKSNVPCDLFITSSRILISTDDARVFARSLKFIQKIQLASSQITLTLGKVGGTEKLLIKTVPYARILDNLLSFILK